MRTDEFTYELPADLIAQHPASRRDASRLLVLNRADRNRTHENFPALLQYLSPGDLLVLNNSKVIPARLRAIKPVTGGAVELLLAEEVSANEWWVMLKPGKRVRPGTVLHLLDRAGELSSLQAEVQEKDVEGHYRVRFNGAEILEAVERIGEIPLPPYIERPDGANARDTERYQTTYAGPPGSVAAPTAGLHFTPELLEQVRARGVRIAEVTLHVGLGTFAPVKSECVEQHRMHYERFKVPTETAALVNETKKAGGRVIAVGTTSVRVLESAARAAGEISAGSGKTNIFIFPPYRFKIVDALLTNFHLPESTLLMLASAFAGRELILETYAEAVRERYRFFSYGDAMLIL